MSSTKSKEGTSSKSSDDKDKESPKDLQDLFSLYAKFADRDSDGTIINLKNIDKWLKQANVLNNKKKGISNSDTSILFAGLAKHKRMNFEDFKAFINTLEANKKLDKGCITEALISAGKPSLTNRTSPITEGKIGAHLRRMTEPRLSKGSVDRHASASAGYVSGFKKVTDEDKKDSKDRKDSKDKKNTKDEKETKKKCH